MPSPMASGLKTKTLAINASVPMSPRFRLNRFTTSPFAAKCSTEAYHLRKLLGRELDSLMVGETRCAFMLHAGFGENLLIPAHARSPLLPVNWWATRTSISSHPPSKNLTPNRRVVWIPWRIKTSVWSPTRRTPITIRAVSVAKISIG